MTWTIDMVKRKRKFKVNLFNIFKHITSNNTNYFNSLTEDEKKELSPYVMQRWMIGASDNSYMHIILTNSYLNPYVFSLCGHDVLLFKLCTVANGGYGHTRFKFQKPSRTKISFELRTIMQYYNCNHDEAKGIVKLLSHEDIQDIKEQITNED